MLKTLLTLSAAALLLAPCAQAQGHRGGSQFAARDSMGRGNFGHNNNHHGHYYYRGGIAFFDPFFDYGFGYPAYAYGYGIGYNEPYGYGYGYPAGGAYEGQIVPDGGHGQARVASLPAAVQQQLAKQGFYKGAVDGQFGPASRSALSRFQAKNGLNVTGRIDEPTLVALGFSDHP